MRALLFAATSATSLMVVACATTAKFEDRLRQFVGMSEDEVIQRLDPPSSVYQTADTKYITYARARSGYLPGTPPSYQTQIIGNTAYTQPVGGTPGFACTQTCTYTFGLQDRRVATYRFEGNACRAR
jgi:hypothetical protein